MCRQILTEMSEQGGTPLRRRMTRELWINSRKGWRDRFSDRLRHLERLGVKLRLKHHLSQQLTHFGGTARGRGMGRKRINTFGS